MSRGKTYTSLRSQFIIPWWFFSNNCLVMGWCCLLTHIKNEKLLTYATHTRQPLHHFLAAHMDDCGGGKNIPLCHWMLLSILFLLDGTYMMMMSGLVSIWFSFLPFISLSYASIFALSMEKKHNIIIGFWAALRKKHDSPRTSFLFRFGPCFIWKNHFKLESFFYFYPP